MQRDGAIEISLSTLPDGAILFDRARLPQAQPAMLSADYWQVGGDNERGGRGQIWFVEGEFGAGVLRHYRRGGMVARVNRDRFLYAGMEATRSFREFRLLAELKLRGLPVPAPLLAGYRRVAPCWYRADLLTARIAAAQTLAERLPAVLDDRAALHEVGRTLARFHAAGVCHADLNAHNIMLDREGRCWLIDFDRGRLRVPARDWQQRRLQRLRRSLLKLGAGASAHWPQAFETLRTAHDEALR